MKIDPQNFTFQDPPAHLTPLPDPPPEPLPITERTLAEGAGEPSKEEALRQLLADRAFNYAIIPPKPHPILKLGKLTISTGGNLTSIQGPVKAGKTAVIEAVIAAAMNGNRIGPDTLNFSACNIKGHAMIHIDTEQSRYDSDAIVRRAMRRADVIAPPEWFSSYNLTDLTVDQRCAAMELLIAELGDEHDGVFMLIIDGIADLIASPNDETEAYALVARLHALAIKHDCAIIGILHENPGSENGKMRGHLGSQLERKAETPLRLAKDASTGVTTVWSDRARHCHLPKDDGLCFAWSDAMGMHVSVGTAREMKASSKRAKLREEAQAAFGHEDEMTYTRLTTRLAETSLIAPKTAEKRVKSLSIEGIIFKQSSGGYTLKP